MTGIRRALSQSLATKVILSTVLLSLGVISLVGSALNSRLSDGLRSSSFNSAISESKFTFFDAEYKLAISRDSTIEERKKILADIVVNATTQVVKEARREIIFHKAPSKKKSKVSYEMTSARLKASSIPEDLRKRVADGTNIENEYAPVEEKSGLTREVLIVGKRVNIPAAGLYEMYIVFSLDNQTATLGLIRNSLIFTGFGLIFLIAMITWLVLRQVVKPVREAARIATQFTQGDFSQRMQVKSNDEIASLGNAFNEMAESLEKQIARLENLSRVQQRFVSDVSHELRTPLTTLRMASEVIHNAREGFDPVIARSSELLIGQIDRFERLLEDLLEISRFDAEVAVLEAVEFDICGSLERCISDLSLVASENGIDINLNRPRDSVFINGDIRRVERVIRNLLSNAIDHSEGKPVEVRIMASAEDVAIGVRDYGVGIEPKLLNRVFDRFWRADPSRARTRGGTGLGLSIALEDARLHNGELEAWGEPGKGAHFVLYLPRRAGDQLHSRLISLKG
jgi:two-component system sensor histidine kinase MtrB